MKKYLIFFSFNILFHSFLGAKEYTGKDIMLISKNREKNKTSSYKIEMTLINARGNKRIREVSAYKKNYGDDEKSVMVFLKPADFKGVGYLSI